MKTAIYVCDGCGAVTFRPYACAEVEPRVCGLVRVELNAVEETAPENAPVFFTRQSVCRGTVEYYAYDDFDRFK